MKTRCFIVVLILILTAVFTPVSASDGDLQFGVRLGLNRNIYFSEYLSPIFSMDMGNGFEAGLVAKYPLTNRLSLNSNISFCYRVLGGYKDKGWSAYYDEDSNGELIFVDYINYDIKTSFREMAVLVPVIIHFTAIQSTPFYVSTGVQLGFPFNNEFKGLVKNYTLDGNFFDEFSVDESDDGHRSSIDFGIAFGIGFIAMPNLGVDLWFVTNLNRVYDKRYYGKTSLKYFTFGISYFL